MSTRVELEQDRERWSSAPDNIRADISDGPLTAPLGSHNRTAVYCEPASATVTKYIQERDNCSSVNICAIFSFIFITCLRVLRIVHLFYFVFVHLFLYLPENNRTGPNIVYDGNGKQDVVYT